MESAQLPHQGVYNCRVGWRYRPSVVTVETRRDEDGPEDDGRGGSTKKCGVPVERMGDVRSEFENDFEAAFRGGAT